MLTILIAGIAICALAVIVAAKAAQIVMSRLGLDALTVLLWLGLAERPSARD